MFKGEYMNSRLHMGRTSIGVTDFSPWRKQLALTLVDKEGFQQLFKIST